jgi:hypothetical protein
VTDHLSAAMKELNDRRPTADTPDPRPMHNCGFTYPGHQVPCSHGYCVECHGCKSPDPRPVSPPSELTAEEVRATNALFEAMREAGLFGRKRQAVEDAAHHLAAVARAAARAAPQADANLEGYWERAYWEIVPKLQAALDAAPQADAGTLRALADAWWAESQGDSIVIHDAGILQRCATDLRAALSASSPATAGREG